MVIKHGKHLGVVISMNQIEKGIFNFVIEETNGVLVTFIGDIYDMRIANCPGNEPFLEDIKKTAKDSCQ